MKSEKSRRRVLGALAAAGTAAVAGCSSSSDEATTVASTSTDTATATATETATQTATATATPVRPNVERQIILRDQAAIVHIRRSVTGEIVWPSFTTYNLLDPDVLGRWESGDFALEFYDDRTFIYEKPDETLEGGFAAVDGLLVLSYSDGSEFSYDYEVASTGSGVEITFTPEDGDSLTYERTRDDSDDRSIVEIADDAIILEDEDATEEGGELETGSAGSGFTVHPDGYVVTNAHVVGAHREPAETLKVRLAVRTRDELRRSLEEEYDLADDEREEVQEILLDKLLSYYAENASVRNVSTSVGVLHGRATPEEDVTVQTLPASVERTGSVTETVDGEVTWGRDVAILKVDAGVPLPTVPLGDAGSLGTGATSIVVGYPAIGIESYFEDRETTLEPTLTSGVVSARRTLTSGIEAIQTDAGINNGNSGGPIYDGDGNVVGIATFKPADVDVEEVAFGLPIEVAKGFLVGMGVDPQRGELDDVYEDALNALWREDCESVSARVADVKDLWPAHPYADDLVEACEE